MGARRPDEANIHGHIQKPVFWLSVLVVADLSYRFVERPIRGRSTWRAVPVAGDTREPLTQLTGGAGSA
jgi:peptidoglycan/LPS O-acetylase OafA/YrhL